MKQLPLKSIFLMTLIIAHFACRSVPDRARAIRDTQCNVSFQTGLVIPDKARVPHSEIRALGPLNYVPASRYNSLANHAGDVARCLKAEECLRRWTEWERECAQERVRILESSLLPGSLSRRRRCGVQKPACVIAGIQTEQKKLGLLMAVSAAPIGDRRVEVFAREAGARASFATLEIRSKMAYSPDIRARAFALFLQGDSPEAIARTLRESGDPSLKKLSSNTVRGWAENPDAKGDTWDDRRRAVEVVIQQRIESQAADSRARVGQQLTTLRQRLYDVAIGEAAPKAKSLEGVVYAFRAMAEAENQMLAEIEAGASPLDVADAVMNSLKAVPAVAKVLAQHWDEVQRHLVANLEALRQRSPGQEGQRKEIEVRPA